MTEATTWAAVEEESKQRGGSKKRKRHYEIEILQRERKKLNPRVPWWTLWTGRCYILFLLQCKHYVSLLLCLAGWFWGVANVRQLFHLYFSQKLAHEKHVQACVCVYESACALVCNQYLVSFCCSDMNNRSIAWWLRQIGLPQYTKTLESEYYGLEVREHAKCVFSLYVSISLSLFLLFCALIFTVQLCFILCSPCVAAGFAECNWWRAEGCRDRGCNTQRDHPQPAFKTQRETGSTFWWHTYTPGLGDDLIFIICWTVYHINQVGSYHFVPNARLDYQPSRADDQALELQAYCLFVLTYLKISLQMCSIKGQYQLEKGLSGLLLKDSPYFSVFQFCADILHNAN